jgi:hypothetical protein
MNNPEFDQFPVKQGPATVGMLLRQADHERKTVYEAMQPLSEGLIVSADMPLADLIPQLRDSHSRLVLRGGRLDGLVTQSDLLRLPVRMLLFGLISHLELCLRSLVRKRIPLPKWLELLPADRRREITGKLREFADARFEPDPLEFTNFSDVLNMLALQSDLGLGGRFKTETDAIRDLRNDVAHAKTFVASVDDVSRFVDRFTYIRDWIGRISAMLKAPQ